MLQILKLVVVMAGMLYVNNVSANDVQKFEEVKQADGSILVEKWEKIGEFVTESVPEGVVLDLQQKEMLWKGEDIKKNSQKIFITGILHPNIKKVAHEKSIKWFDGKYNIDHSKKYVSSNTNLLTVVLYAIIFGMLFINILAVCQRHCNYKGIFVYNCVMLVANPVIAIIGIIFMYKAISVVDGSVLEPLFAVAGFMLLIVASMMIPFIIVVHKSYENLCVGLLLDSPWLTYAVGVLSIVVSIGIVTISSFVYWDVVLVYESDSGIMAEWILYLVACFVCLPPSSILVKSVSDSLRKKVG